MFSPKAVKIIGLVVLVAATLLLLSLSSRRPYPGHGPGRVAISIVAPFQQLIVSTTRFSRRVWDHYFYLATVAQENDRLRKELHKASLQKNRLEETDLANRRLRRLLGLTRRIDRPMIAAEVVGKDPSPWFQSVLVSKGRSDGVARGMPVVGPEGVVGVVVEAAAHYAKVMLITDPNSAVDALIQDSRARGIIKGGTSGRCAFKYVLRKHDLRVGDKVVSSGMDGVFPKGLPIGRVNEIIKQDAGIFQQVTVTPIEDFERLEEVLVITPAISEEGGDPS